MSPASGFSGKIEFTARFAPRPLTRYVLFDFDGTLSLIRQGWSDVMVPMFAELLPPRASETPEQIQQMMFEDIMRLNGKQTIFQMIQFAERVRERGGEPLEPLAYKHEYLRRLQERIQHRLDAIQARRADEDQFLVYGARRFLESLHGRGLTLVLASGTDEPYVRQEAELLGLTRYFGERIYGALDDYRQFSKKMVIERLLRENEIDGSRLVSFGDGYVEIQNTVEVGGLAVAVASDEARNGSGEFDAWKRERLLDVGAAVVIPDYRDGDVLIARLFGQ